MDKKTKKKMSQQLLIEYKEAIKIRDRVQRKAAKAFHKVYRKGGYVHIKRGTMKTKAICEILIVNTINNSHSLKVHNLITNKKYWVDSFFIV